MDYRFTGKERDSETGFDYFEARYLGSTNGRFVTPDIPFLDQKPTNPQTWNLYAYGRNNPLSHVDPSGNIVETVWDIANVALDVTSLASNVAEGNWGAAAVDAGGLVIDVAATAIPFVPGGAGTAIKAARMADKGYEAVKSAKRVEATIVDSSKVVSKLEKEVQHTVDSTTNVPKYARNKYSSPSPTKKGDVKKNNPVCVYCDKKPSTTVDHVRSQKEDWVNGGFKDTKEARSARVNDSENLTGACKSCNSSKGSKKLNDEWIPPKER